MLRPESDSFLWIYSVNAKKENIRVTQWIQTLNFPAPPEKAVGCGCVRFSVLLAAYALDNLTQSGMHREPNGPANFPPTCMMYRGLWDVVIREADHQRRTLLVASGFSRLVWISKLCFPFGQFMNVMLPGILWLTLASDRSLRSMFVLVLSDWDSSRQLSILAVFCTSTLLNCELKRVSKNLNLVVSGLYSYYHLLVHALFSFIGGDDKPDDFGFLFCFLQKPFPALRN